MAYTERDTYGMYKNQTGKKGPGPALMGADTLIGDDVYNQKEENLGDIKEIMLDMRSGKVAYAVLSLGGFLGMGEKLFAVPWNALKLDTANHRFVLNVDKETLETAPGFDKDVWPDMADPMWEKEVHSFYGTEAYSPEKSYSTEQSSSGRQTATGQKSLVTGLFRDKQDAEQAYQAAIRRGYQSKDLNLVMTDETRKRYFAGEQVETELGTKATEGMGVGGAIGSAVGGIAGAIAAVGTSLAIPGLGLVVAGPLAAAIAGMGAGGAAGSLVGGLIGLGIPDERVKHYDKGIKEGGILLSVQPRSEDDAQFLEKQWKESHGEQVYR